MYAATNNVKPLSLTVNDLMILAADGDQAAINVLDMIDEHVVDRRTAPERLGELYWASK